MDLRWGKSAPAFRPRPSGKAHGSSRVDRAVVPEVPVIPDLIRDRWP